MIHSSSRAVTFSLASYHQLAWIAKSIIDQLEPILNRAAPRVHRNAGPPVLNAGTSVKFETHEPGTGFFKLAIAAVAVTSSIAYGQVRPAGEKRPTCNRITHIEF